MLINQMSDAACQDMLNRAKFGRLACMHGGQPYIVPVSFAYNDHCFYSFSELGLKIECMRANPLVCVQVDEISTAREWTSVVALGRYEELPDTPEFQEQRMVAWTIVQRTPNWWQPGSIKLSQPNEKPPPAPVWYRISLNEITGRQASEPAA
jgi:nitroimidazol reductase NimA-like FMN-containing flavoprotein (pyridoxamine 5'-phosphate oxidase superfamily)